MSDRTKATFAQLRAGAADLATVTTSGHVYFLVRVTADEVYTAPLGTPLVPVEDEPGPAWMLMADVSGNGLRRNCNLCRIPLGIGACTHTDVRADHVVMSRQSWHRMTDEIDKLRTFVGRIADGDEAGMQGPASEVRITGERS